jgi:putative serine protease PepD
MEGSPAAEAGLVPGDVVTRAAGRLVTSRPDLVAAVRSMRPQDQLELQWQHDGKPRSATITLKAIDPALYAYAPAMG